MSDKFRSYFKQELEEEHDIALQEGLQEGRQEGKLEQLFSLVNKNLLSVEVASKEANMTKEEFVEKMESASA